MNPAALKTWRFRLMPERLRAMTGITKLWSAWLYLSQQEPTVALFYAMETVDSAENKIACDLGMYPVLDTRGHFTPRPGPEPEGRKR